MSYDIQKSYLENRDQIKDRLRQFKNLEESEYKKEFLFCLLTPQSKAENCWKAVLEICNLNTTEEDVLRNILRSKVRFHNTKAKRIIKGIALWDKISMKLSEKDIVALRNWLSVEVHGYGLKESSHFLRNIGKSNGKIAILDRHILRNLKLAGVIEDEKIKGRNDYLKIEEKYLSYAKEIGIASDELDLLWWEKEHGLIFK